MQLSQANRKVKDQNYPFQSISSTYVTGIGLRLVKMTMNDMTGTKPLYPGVDNVCNPDCMEEDP